MKKPFIKSGLMTRLFIILTISFLFDFQSQAQSYTYNFSAPSQKVNLPGALYEVSGLTVIDESTLACVQDELGIVFFYDLDKKEISNEIHFEKTGDFEGITKVDSSLFILRSDGNLTEIVDYKSVNRQIRKYDTGVPANDNEGLCYDYANNRLLIGCKSKLNLKSMNKDTRAIFGFGLESKKLTANPVMEFDVNELMDFTSSQNISFPDKVKKNGEVKPGKLKFKMSAIAIHPISRKLYVISAADYLLFVFDESGNPEYVAQLDKKLFNKAEGLTFLDNGDMLITNEGQDHKPTLLRFDLKETKTNKLNNNKQM